MRIRTDQGATPELVKGVMLSLIQGLSAPSQSNVPQRFAKSAALWLAIFAGLCAGVAALQWLVEAGAL